MWGKFGCVIGSYLKVQGCEEEDPQITKIV